MRRVLVIDDHQPSRGHLVTILNKGEYEIAGEAKNRAGDGPNGGTRCPDDGCQMSNASERLVTCCASHQLPIVLITSHHDAPTSSARS